MPTIAVYRFETYDEASRTWVKQPYCATRAHIESMRGAMYFNTKREVDSAHVVEGVYQPPAA